MNELPADDWKLWQDEIQRCDLLSVAVTATAPPERTTQMRNARYYADRARILRLVGPERAVTALREEVLRALAGEPPDSHLYRWFRLHSLEFGGLKPRATMTEIMGLGVEKLVAEGIADRVAERNREERRIAAEARAEATCPGCHPGRCDGSCY